MSPPSKRTAPPCGAISPARRPMSVVLPAPFGPITACSSPGGTASVIASAATTPPKRLLRPSICNSGSATQTAPKQSGDPAVHVDRDQEQERTEDQVGILGDARQRLLQQQESHRSEQRAEAAEDDHDDEIAGARPMHHRRADEVGVISEERAG